MSVSEEVVRLILETKGQETIERLEKSTEEYKALLSELAADYAKGEVKTGEFLKTQKAWSAELEREADLLNRLKAATSAQAVAADTAEAAIYDLADAYDLVGDEMTQIVATAPKVATAFNQTAVAQAGAIDKIAKSTGKASSGLKGLGQVGLQTGRIIQDVVQGGIGGGLNNIEQFVQAAGGSAGLAGVLTGLGVAAFLAKPYIDDFMEALSPEKPQQFADSLKILQARIKELEEKPIKFGIDASELDKAKEQLKRLQEARAAYEAAREGRTVEEKAAGDKFVKEFGELGGEGRNAVDTITEQQAKQRDAIDTDINKALNKMAEASTEIQKATKLYGVAPGVQPLTPDWQKLPMAVQHAITAARDRSDQALREIGTRQEINRKAASDQIGDLVAKTNKGNDAGARSQLADLFRQSGLGRIAALTESTSPAAMKARAAADLVQRQTVQLDEHNARESEAGQRHYDAEAKRKEAERIRQANEAAKELENDPIVQAEGERYRRQFGDIGREVSPDAQAARAAAERAKEVKAQAKEGIGPVNQDDVARAAQDLTNLANGIVTNQALLGNKMLMMGAQARAIRNQQRQVEQFLRNDFPTNLGGGHQ